MEAVPALRAQTDLLHLRREAGYAGSCTARDTLSTVRAQGRGEVIVVRHPEQVFLADKKTTVIIDATDKIHILDVAHISKLALSRNRPGSSPGNPNRK